MKNIEQMERSILFAYESDELPLGTVPEETVITALTDLISIVAEHGTAVNTYLSAYEPHQLYIDYITTRQGMGLFPPVTGTSAKDILDEAVTKLSPLPIPEELTSRIF